MIGTPGPSQRSRREVIQDMAYLRNTLAAVLGRIGRNDEDGQGLAEYALILALIAIIAIVALIFMGSQVSDKLSNIGSTLQSYAP